MKISYKSEKVIKDYFCKSEHFKVVFPKGFLPGLTWDIIGVGVMDNTVENWIENWIGLRQVGKHLISGGGHGICLGLTFVARL